jgi:hypothetical protein
MPMDMAEVGVAMVAVQVAMLLAIKAAAVQVATQVTVVINKTYQQLTAVVQQVAATTQVHMVQARVVV